MLGEENVAKAWPVTILLLIYCGSMSKGPSSGEIIAKKKEKATLTEGGARMAAPSQCETKRWQLPGPPARQDRRLGVASYFFFFCQNPTAGNCEPMKVFQGSHCLILMCF